ncbi:MAG: DUF3131 domain-containing protein [Amylibacter sp.]|nr:DUF3131 domain-containing protein [Amylibacter sp.]
MNIAQNLIKARSHFAFIIGLSLAAILAISLDSTLGYTWITNNTRQTITSSPDQTQLATRTALSPYDLQNARVAWGYFERNYNPETGLVNSVNGFPSTTIWDQSSYLLGLISAYKIGVVDKGLFDARMSQALKSLSQLVLFSGKLPNKVYDTRLLQMTTYSNDPIETGIGWSALDIARMTVPLNILLYDYPQHAGTAGNILKNWDFSAMVKNGVLMGARLNPETNQPEVIQEGRLGYEEYGARAVSLLGMDTMTAAKYDDFIKFKTIEGQRIAADSRTFNLFDAPNYVISEPYILMAIEFGLDTKAKELAHRIYKAQENRYLSSGQLTAVSEDNIDQEPYFIYNTVFANGRAWSAVDDKGARYPELKTLSTKAAFGWHALYNTDYTRRLMAEIQKTQTADQGWMSGVYENDGRVNAVSTANTNGIILEIINYKANGPLISARFTKENTQ